MEEVLFVKFPELWEHFEAEFYLGILGASFTIAIWYIIQIIKFIVRLFKKGKDK